VSRQDAVRVTGSMKFGAGAVDDPL
jgi:hypothetical protein